VYEYLPPSSVSADIDAALPVIDVLATPTAANASNATAADDPVRNGTVKWGARAQFARIVVDGQQVDGMLTSSRSGVFLPPLLFFFVLAP
jgi:hypothetical protein